MVEFDLVAALSFIVPNMGLWIGLDILQFANF
jgi:hypothetical protein